MRLITVRVRINLNQNADFGSSIIMYIVKIIVSSTSCIFKREVYSSLFLFLLKELDIETARVKGLTNSHFFFLDLFSCASHKFFVSFV